MYYKKNKFDKNRILDNFININWLIIGILVILFIVGCFVIYSASGGSFYPLVEKHIYKFIFSFIIFIIHYKFLVNFLHKSLAIGAADFEPLPPCSTIILKAYLGLLCG